MLLVRIKSLSRQYCLWKSAPPPSIKSSKLSIKCCLRREGLHACSKFRRRGWDRGKCSRQVSKLFQICNLPKNIVFQISPQKTKENVPARSPNVSYVSLSRSLSRNILCVVTTLAKSFQNSNKKKRNQHKCHPSMCCRVYEQPLLLQPDPNTLILEGHIHANPKPKVLYSERWNTFHF